MNTPPSFIGFVLGIIAIAILLYSERHLKSTYLKCLWRSTLLFCSLYVAILLVLAINAQYLSFRLDSFDVNQNGSIEWEEYTEEYRTLRDRLLRDPDRNNAYFNGAILSSAMALIALALDLFATFFFQSKTERIKL